MAEILVRMKVDVWGSERPEVSWVQVSRRTPKMVYYYKLLKERSGKIHKVDYGFPVRRLERVENANRGIAVPGVKAIRWLQDDREPIVGGEQYCMALFNVLEQINAEMRDAAVRINELEDSLPERLGG